MLRFLPFWSGFRFRLLTLAAALIVLFIGRRIVCVVVVGVHGFLRKWKLLIVCVVVVIAVFRVNPLPLPLPLPARR